MDTANYDFDSVSENLNMLTGAEKIEKYSLITGNVLKAYGSVLECATEEYCDEELVRKCCNGLNTEVCFSMIETFLKLSSKYVMYTYL